MLPFLAMGVAVPLPVHLSVFVSQSVWWLQHDTGHCGLPSLSLFSLCTEAGADLKDTHTAPLLESSCPNLATRQKTKRSQRTKD